MWKIQMVLIKEEIYDSLIIRGLFTEEQKECHKRTRGTVELLYIDQNIHKKRKMRRNNEVMEWTDYTKAYDMVP